MLRKLVGTAAIAAAVAASFSSSANANLVISLTPTSGTPNNVKANDVLTYNVVATITGGANTTADESLFSLYGSLISVPGASGPVGNFSAFVPSASFNSNSGQNGVQQDLNGLPGLDLGSLPTAADVPNSYIFARGAAQVTGATPDTATFVIGSVTFTVTSATVGVTQLSWFPRTDTAGAGLNVAASWREDGAAKNPSNTLYSGIATTITATPEPGSLALAGMGGVGLLLRRRRK